MAIDNVTVVDTTSKYIVKSIGVGSEDYQKMIEPSVPSISSSASTNQ